MIKQALSPGKILTALSALTLTMGVLHQSAQAQSAPVTSSLRFQDVMETCAQNGYVNLGAGAASNGAVICRDGSANSSVQYKEYANMIAHWLAASFLVGFRMGVGENLDLGVTWANSPEGKAEIDQQIQKVTNQGGLVLPQIYRDRMKQEISFFLANSQRMQQLVGNSREYGIVAKNFCAPKGQSISAVQKLVPNLTITQMYAVCAMEDQKANPQQ